MFQRGVFVFALNIIICDGRYCRYHIYKEGFSGVGGDDG